MGAALKKIHQERQYRIEFPAMEWDQGSKGRHGSLTSDGAYFYNIRSERRQLTPSSSATLRFSGVRGNIPLGNDGVIYYEVHLYIVAFVSSQSWAKLGEVGLASEEALATSTEHHPVHRRNKGGLSLRLGLDEKNRMLCIQAYIDQKVLKPEEQQLELMTDRNSHHALGFLFVGPKSKLHITNAMDSTVLWKCKLDAKEPLWPYIGIRDGKGKRLCCLHIKPNLETTPEKIAFLQDLIHR